MVIDDLVRFNDFAIQMFLRDFGPGDLAVALKGTSEELQKRFFSNMTKGVVGMIKERMGELGPVTTDDIKAVHDRMVKAAQQMDPEAATRPAAPLREDYLAIKRALTDKLAQTPFADFTLDGVADVLSELAAVARTEGILGVEELIPLSDCRLLRIGLQLSADGTERALVHSVLKSGVPNLMHEHETKYQMVVEALTAIAHNTHPALVECKLRILYETPPASIRSKKSSGKPADPGKDVSEKLRDASFQQLDLNTLTEVLTNMAWVARQEGIPALDRFAEHVDDPLMAQALRMAVEGEKSDAARAALEAQIPGLLHQHATRYTMLIEGIRLIQTGEKPDGMQKKMRSFYLSGFSKK